MANIKFSDFTVGNTEGDIDFVVGYKGANNIQISPTNLLASALGNYLPLAGGTMVAGSSVLFPDNSFLRFGSGADATIYHDGLDAYFKNFTGKLIIQNNTNDNDVVFQSDDGAGGVATYFFLDGSAASGGYIYTVFPDKSAASFGDSFDFNIFHYTHSYISNDTGNLIIQNNANDGDIIFKSDDGSGGLDTYFSVVGAGNRVQYNKDLRLIDNVDLTLGSSDDLKIIHNGTFSSIQNNTGDFKIINYADNSDIVFESDNGSGGTATYFYLDGGNVLNRFEKSALFADNVSANFGNGFDLQIYHNGSDSYIDNVNNHLVIQNQSANKDIIFKSDDGSGGLATYFQLDGSSVTTVVSKEFKFEDDVKANFGTGVDLQIYHNGNNSLIRNNTGNLDIANLTDDGDILFKCDNGSGGAATYFFLDGSKVDGGNILGATVFPDNSKIYVGSSYDLEIFHNGVNDTWIDNINGNLNIRNQQNSGDIIFRCDNGNGGIIEYLRIDGGAVKTIVSKNFAFLDSVAIELGDSGDFNMFHDGTDVTLQNFTGDFNIVNKANDKDVKFYSDDGSGGTAQYFRLDGGSVTNQFLKTVKLYDNVPLWIGDNNDLQIYHDGSHSYIQDAGTGVLKILGSGVTIQNAVGSENMAVFTENDTVILYNNGVEKIRTIGSGVRISGVSEYADNTAAIAGGLTTGDVYRTGDLLKIVH